MPWPPPSSLPTSPFPNRAVAAAAAVASTLLTPGSWTLDRLLALLLPTTAQRARWRRRRARPWVAVTTRVLATPALLLALVLALPATLLGFLVWLPVQAKRRPVVCHRDPAAVTPGPWDARRARGFTVVTANVCLLPSGMARFSNLGRTRRRAEVIGGMAAGEGSGWREGLLEGRRGEGRDYGGVGGATGEGWGGGGTVGGTAALVGDGVTWLEMGMANPTLMVNPTPPAPVTNPTPVTNPWPTADSVPALESPMTNPTPVTNPAPPTPLPPERPIPLPDPMPPVLTTHLPPDADLLCLQEVFDGAAAAALLRRLGRRFPHVLWGVGPGGLRGGRLKVMGSGLMVASRWPVPAARFHAFPVAAREDALANKGLLAAQVLLGTRQGRRVVGYLGCTHLQAPAGDVTIRDAQLSLSLRWLRDFRRDQQRPGDLVAFDVLCGDLNFDNCSLGDAQNQRHPLFQEFWDPAQRQPGRDQPWAIGTLLDYLKIYEEPVSSPERMERTLSDPRGRAQFLAGPLPPCDPSVTPVTPPATPATQPWQGRRVDRVLLRRDPEMATEVTGYSVITQLATLSDHLPVALRLRLGPADL
ncbi:sphingomyelin phosphodiesterase 5-like [Chamaea fasciata]|uniref:sphingomyelin phosphodiesterase 5-like n=1 Tax=Chamaea fasciata TaxID=190680 RepID=UPI00336AC780